MKKRDKFILIAISCAIVFINININLAAQLGIASTTASKVRDAIMMGCTIWSIIGIITGGVTSIIIYSAK